MKGKPPCGTALPVRWTFAKRRLDGVCSLMSRVPSGVWPGWPAFCPLRYSPGSPVDFCQTPAGRRLSKALSKIWAGCPSGGPFLSRQEALQECGSRCDCHRQSFIRFAARRTAPFLTNGGKEICITPEKKTGGTAYRGTTGSTAVSIAQPSTKCKGRFSKSLIHPQPAALGRLTGLWFCVKISIHRSSILSTEQEGLLRQLEGVPYGRADA